MDKGVKMSLCKIFYLKNKEDDESINNWLKENPTISITGSCIEHISKEKSRLIIFYMK
jgi:hypothetical protein